MTMKCLEFVNSEARECPTSQPPALYRLEISWDVWDPKAFDQFYMGPKQEGKTVQSGTWTISSDSLDYLMDYAETAAALWSVDKESNPSEPYLIGRFDIRRNGTPLLALSDNKWGAIGDDYLDPWVEHVSQTQLACLPDLEAGKETVFSPTDTCARCAGRGYIPQSLGELLGWSGHCMACGGTGQAL